MPKLKQKQHRTWISRKKKKKNKCVSSFTGYVIKSVYLMTSSLCSLWRSGAPGPSGRTQVRSARVKEGVLESGGEVVQVSVTGRGGGRGWFRGFVFISSWVLPPGVVQYPSHVVSTLFVSDKKHGLHNCGSIVVIFYIFVNSVLTDRSLYLAHDLVVGNCSPGLIVSNDLRLLINFLRKRYEHDE